MWSETGPLGPFFLKRGLIGTTRGLWRRFRRVLTDAQALVGTVLDLCLIPAQASFFQDTASYRRPRFRKILVRCYRFPRHRTFSGSQTPPRPASRATGFPLISFFSQTQIHDPHLPQAHVSAAPSNPSETLDAADRKSSGRLAVWDELPWRRGGSAGMVRAGCGRLSRAQWALRPGW